MKNTVLEHAALFAEIRQLTDRAQEIVNTLCTELSWSHLRLLLKFQDPLKRDFYVELLRLEESNIRVADYLTLLPPQDVLKAKLHRSIEIARQRFALVDKGELI